MNPDQALSLYQQMVKIRKFEEKLYQLFLTQPMPGSMHQYNGQEAVAVGVCAHLKQDDYVSSTHRGHGHCIAKGADLNGVMAEMFAKETGCCRGMGGSMHIADFNVGMIGANAIVGGGIPIAVGAGWTCKYKKLDRVSVVFFGDGAANEGSFHESVNLAAIWQLPVIFVCENNLYGFSTHYRRTMLIDNIADRAQAYGIPGVIVDGQDLSAVYDVAGQAITNARTGKGPTLIECKTYRYRGHSRFETPNYRTKEELQQWQQRDPIVLFAQHLRQEHNVSEDQLTQIDQDVDRLMDAAVEFSEQSPDPKPDDYQKYILA